MDLYNRINKKVQILYGKEFTGFSIGFSRDRAKRLKYASPSICPKLDGVPHWYIYNKNFNGSIETYAEELDEYLANRLEELTSKINDALKTD